MTSKYRSKAIADSVIAFSISYQRENLLARGMGLEHLRELLIRLARPTLRQGASLAYGGHWKETEDNFTYDLLRLISAEQEDNSLGGPDSNLQIGKLYNHSAWPYYFEITPKIEAQWINCCRIVRITQKQAGLSDSDIVRDADAQNGEPRTVFNTAVTLSAMRRLMMQEMFINIPDVRKPERIPPVVARILLGGKVDSYAGFMPGIFEEALVTLQQKRPLFVLGGFGGATEILARALLATENARPPELTLAWHKERNALLTKLVESSQRFTLPAGLSTTESSLNDLFTFVEQARSSLSGTLNTGLSDEETRELLTTRNVADAVHLVRTGLINQNKLPTLPA